MNCQITDIGLWFEGHGVCSLRVELGCCAFHIRLSQLNRFMREFLRCFDLSSDTLYIESLKGKYLRAIFDERLDLVGLQHITKDYTIDLTNYFEEE